ncbi:hypothetical protein F5882DRAFT_459875 [Hyaloscypha sp. PMI_1271]|nr:hypothetical protein F5882DRAFT_459875 [Hyaloscypha sp. PMI_1271]
MAGLVACRSFLGIFEAGFGAGAPFFLLLFYQRPYEITHIHTSWGAWRYLFIIGGVPTILSAPIVVFFFLADFPGTAKFLLQDTQTLAVECLQTRDTTAKHKV